jgi:hypothetical protein
MKIYSGNNIFILLSLYILVSIANGNSHNYAAKPSTSIDYSKSSKSEDETAGSLTNGALHHDANEQQCDIREEFKGFIQSSSTMTAAASSFEGSSGVSTSFSSSISMDNRDTTATTATASSISSVTNHGSATSSPNSRDGKLISLDLAGEVHTHVFSPYPMDTDYQNGCMTQEGRINSTPAATTTTTTTPLFYCKARNARRGIGSSLLPNVYIGSKYDFKKVWWGATRLMTTISWGYDSTINKKGRYFVSKLKGEVGTLHPHDYSLEAGIKIPTRNINGESNNDSNVSIMTDMDSMVSVQYNTLDKGLMTTTRTTKTMETMMMGVGHSATVAARLRLHNRFAIMIKGIITKIGGDADSQQDNRNAGGFEYFQHRIPQQPVQWSEGSWLPDVKMTAGGKVVAKSAIGFRNRYQFFDDNNGAYIRLMASRQLNWNVLGILQGYGFQSGLDHDDRADYDNNETLLRLEIGAALRDGTFTCVAAEAIVEKLIRTFRCTLTQEQIFALK